MRNPIRPYVVAFMLLAGIQAIAQDEPTIAKDSVQVKTWKAENGPSRRSEAPPAWIPEIKFRVNGPVASGSRFWVEYALPIKKKWLSVECGTREIDAGKTWETECGERNVADSLGYTGIMEFSIHVANELIGTNITLFKGKAKVARTPAPAQNKTFFDYYFDEDWRVPIGYLSHGRTLNIEMWFRGRPGETRPFIFYKGKQVAKGENCGGADFEPKAYVWWNVKCEFFSDSGGDDFTDVLKKNPGDYEIKVLQEGRLTRTGTFTVDAEGNYDNGIATENKVGSDVVIVPFKILVDHAPWNKLAWKTEAYYGNPLTGFTAP